MGASRVELRAEVETFEDGCYEPGWGRLVADRFATISAGIGGFGVGC